MSLIAIQVVSVSLLFPLCRFLSCHLLLFFPLKSLPVIAWGALFLIFWPIIMFRGISHRSLHPPDNHNPFRLWHLSYLQADYHDWCTTPHPINCSSIRLRNKVHLKLSLSYHIRVYHRSPYVVLSSLQFWSSYLWWTTRYLITWSLSSC